MLRIHYFLIKRKKLFRRPNMSVIANDDEKEETVGRRITGNGH